MLLADDDVIVRMALGEYLRTCGLKVLEAASGKEAKAVLQSGIDVDVVLSDAQLAGEETGFALAQWIRRYRPTVEVILTSTVLGKAQAASEFCARFPTKAPYDSSGLAARIRALAAERKRRARPPSSTDPVPRKRRRP
ncbi:MAG TPA: response regulator [Vitreimonas sp.]|uniref:response regulator n=1 Tax=Vitreimonas sp. TaxID=3069702 RepID=UPI002D5CB860|nr:response regulator [Vitreimonas sp.]HYD86209.1 response regulator [Vitreimonas sp.]